MRVVSLVPSATETLVALGTVPVGCTRFCALDGVAIVGGTKRVDVDAVAALTPDLVVVNDEENRLVDAEALAARGLTLFSLSPRSVADVGPALAALAARIDAKVPAPFEAWDAWMQATARAPRGRVFVPVWHRPDMSLAADTYGSSLLAHIGFDNVYAGARERYPEVELADVAARRPDVVLLPSEPYVFGERHVAEFAAAVPGARVELVDGRDLFWWGSRTPDAARRLAEAC